MRENSMLYALIGDIKNSKKIKNRNEIQEKLKTCFKSINEEYEDILESKFVITLGDEFQALFKDAALIFEVITKIDFYMEEIKIRFSIGVGEIVTSIEKQQAIGMDGSAWWRAREAIIDIKKNHERGIKGITNLKVSGIKKTEIENLINSTLILCHTAQKKWNKEQKRVIKYIVSNYGIAKAFVQKNIADNLNTSPENLNKILKNSKFYDYVNSLNNIAIILKNEGEY